jgi:hypothetical protein
MSESQHPHRFVERTVVVGLATVSLTRKVVIRQA